MTQRFTNKHEWIIVNGDIGTIGITDYAQNQLGDIVFVELPDVGRSVNKGDDAAVVESVKAASEIYTPVTGEIVEVNGPLADNPGEINNDAQGKGWFFKIKLSNPTELDELLDPTKYQELLESLA